MTASNNSSFWDRWFYHPTNRCYGSPDEVYLDYEDVSFDSGNHRLHGWFFPAVGDARGTIVHCHGNGGNVTGHFRFIWWLPGLGWNVLVFDYRGFGRSGGLPTREGTVVDAHAAIDTVKKRADVDDDRILVFGQSLGGAVAVVASAQRSDIAGLALEGAFADYRREANYFCKRSWLSWGAAPFATWLVTDGLDPIDHVAEIPAVPKLFITGDADSICEPVQTRELFDAAAGPKELWVIKGGEHLQALTHTEGEGPKRLGTFFRNCVGVA